eukprot:TRINITY_DN7926_c0_g1_i1.p1 TRINITY_DN7926_c0_g1~~TRINITY_DN7926_c0_g1_i1.p1  ORF type:complete len:259 (-),score=36.32 TRINITY_DN7926_c0_g1_i1:87-863(-)
MQKEIILNTLLALFPPASLASVLKKEVLEADKAKTKVNVWRLPEQGQKSPFCKWKDPIVDQTTVYCCHENCHLDFSMTLPSRLDSGTTIQRTSSNMKSHYKSKTTNWIKEIDDEGSEIKYIRYGFDVTGHTDGGMLEILDDMKVHDRRQQVFYCHKVEIEWLSNKKPGSTPHDFKASSCKKLIEEERKDAETPKPPQTPEKKDEAEKQPSPAPSAPLEGAVGNIKPNDGNKGEESKPSGTGRILVQAFTLIFTTAFLL